MDSIDKQIIQIAHIATRLVTKAQINAPNYKAHSVPEVNCDTCRYFVRDTECELFGFVADADYVCDRHEANVPDVGKTKADVKKKTI